MNQLWRYLSQYSQKYWTDFLDRINEDTCKLHHCVSYT